MKTNIALLFAAACAVIPVHAEKPVSWDRCRGNICLQTAPLYGSGYPEQIEALRLTITTPDVTVSEFKNNNALATKGEPGRAASSACRRPKGTNYARRYLLRKMRSVQRKVG